MHFITNANGQMVDTLQTGETSATRNQNWDTIWVARGRRAPSGWEAELAIPTPVQHVQLARFGVEEEEEIVPQQLQLVDGLALGRGVDLEPLAAYDLRA